MQTFALQRPTLWHVPGRPQTLCKCAVNHRSTFTLDASINIIQVDSFKFNVSSWSGSRCAALCHWEQNNAEWAAHLNANETRWYAACRKEPVRLFGRELHLVETFSAHVGPRELCRELCRMSRQILWLTLSEFKFDSQSWTKLSWQTQMIYAVKDRINWHINRPWDSTTVFRISMIFLLNYYWRFSENHFNFIRISLICFHLNFLKKGLTEIC